MKIAAKGAEQIEVDMTPMIDMTFQLIAFFMILINFSEADADDRVKLPSSVLAKPPQAPLETPITIQLLADGRIFMSGQPYANAAAIRPLLDNERYVLESQGRDKENATIIVRAHKDAKTGQVQDIVKVCQEAGFVKFALRAATDVGY
jgi:biopolymer transport protein ExbD